MDLRYQLSKIVPVPMRNAAMGMTWWQWRDRVWSVRTS